MVAAKWAGHSWGPRPARWVGHPLSSGYLPTAHVQIILDWPKRSLRFFCNIVWKHQKNFWPTQYFGNVALVSLF